MHIKTYRYIYIWASSPMYLMPCIHSETKRPWHNTQQPFLRTYDVGKFTVVFVHFSYQCKIFLRTDFFQNQQAHNTAQHHTTQRVRDVYQHNTESAVVIHFKCVSSWFEAQFEQFVCGNYFIRSHQFWRYK